MIIAFTKLEYTVCYCYNGLVAMSRKYVIIFVLILLVGSFIRLFRIADIPSGFHADEAVFGYNAYSILKTGRDEYGKYFPLILKSFGDYKAAVYSYATIPFIPLFGLTELSVRLPSAISGIFFIILAYLIAFQLSKDRKLALITSLVTAISPMGIVLSRVQSDPLMCIVIFCFAFYCWNLWVEKGKHMYILFAFVSLVLSFLTYVATRLFAIPFFIILGLCYWKSYSAKIRKAYIVSLFVMIVVIVLLSTSSAGTRLSQINIFSKTDVQVLINEEIREDGGGEYPIVTTRIFHNKLTGFARYMLKNYSDYLSANFLFFQAEQPLRERIPNTGIMYLIEFPLLLIGVYMSVKKRLRYGIFSVIWVTMVPLVLSFISGETPNIHRFFLATLPLSLLVGIGILSIVKMLNGFRRSLLIILIIVGYICSIIFFLHELFVHQPVHVPFFRGYAYKALVTDVSMRYKDYSKIVITKSNESPYIYFLFYGAFDPKNYQLTGSHRDLDYQGFDKYVFIPEDCPSFNEHGNTNTIYPYPEDSLLVQSRKCAAGINDNVVGQIYWKDKTVAFQLVEFKATESSLLR